MKSTIFRFAVLCAIVVIAAGTPAWATEEPWLPSLITETPQAGFALAVKMSRMGVKTTQPDVEVLKRARPEYANDAEDLIAASQVIAIHFQTVAAANDYWKATTPPLSK